MYQKFAIALLVAALCRDSAARKSEEKCREYANLVYEDEVAPVLRINAGSNKVSRCAIVETPLIVGGVPAKPAEFPHMAVLGGYDEDLSWNCGGSIISENYILTVAHCLFSIGRSPSKVRVGLNNLLTPGDAMQERNITEMIKYPEYSRQVRYHDIALIKLDRPLELNPRVRPACLEVNSQIPGNTAIVSGFGKTEFLADTGSEDLMKVQLDYVSEDDCKKSYADDIGTRRLPQGLIPNLICAGKMEGGKDSCQGDSGSPLQRVLAEPYCMYSIVGVTSFGKGCALKHMPAVYTRVSSYLDWIETIVWP